MKFSILGGGLLVFLSAVFFSAKAIFVKLAYQYGIDAVSLLTLRMVFSLPFYIVVVLIGIKKYPVIISNKDYVGILFLGLSGYYLASLFDFMGLKYVTAAVERLILFTYPTLVVLLSALMYKKPIKKFQVGALLLTYMGIALTFAANISLSATENFALGAGLIFASALSYAVYLVGSGRLIPRIGSIKFTAYVMTVACGIVIIHYLLTHDVSHLFEFHTNIYLLSLLMAIVSTVLPTFMVSEGIRLIGSNNVSIISSIGPVSTIFLAYLFLNESITLTQLIGTLLVLAGVLMITLNREK